MAGSSLRSDSCSVRDGACESPDFGSNQHKFTPSAYCCEFESRATLHMLLIGKKSRIMDSKSMARLDRVGTTSGCVEVRENVLSLTSEFMIERN